MDYFRPPLSMWGLYGQSRLEGGGHQPILPSAEELIQFTKWVHCVPRLEWSLDDFLHLSTARAWASSALRLLSAPPAAVPHSFQQVAVDWVRWIKTGADDLMLWLITEDPRHWVAGAAAAAQLPPIPTDYAFSQLLRRIVPTCTPSTTAEQSHVICYRRLTPPLSSPCRQTVRASPSRSRRRGSPRLRHYVPSQSGSGACR